ncbi:MAG: hypothetical protein ACREO5_10205, partial [Candidatus Binatia bacterium]
MKAKTLLFSRIPSLLYICLALIILNISCPLEAQEKVNLKDVKITGNVRVEEDGIRLHLKSRAGTEFDQAV